MKIKEECTNSLKQSEKGNKNTDEKEEREGARSDGKTHKKRRETIDERRMGVEKETPIKKIIQMRLKKRKIEVRTFSEE